MPTKATSHSLEMVLEIWNDSRLVLTARRASVDGLDLIELRSITDDGKIGTRVTLTDEQLPLLIEALQHLRSWRRARAEKESILLSLDAKDPVGVVSVAGPVGPQGIEGSR